jgi:LysM repeat protein
MRRFAGFTLSLGFLLVTTAFAQNPSPAPVSSTDLELKSLRESIELQSQQIDKLSLRLDLVLKKLGGKVPEGDAPPEHTAETAPPKALPANAQGTHLVAKGETFTLIAHKYGVSVAELMSVNHISDDRHLQIGQNLIIPMAKSAKPAPSSSTPATEQSVPTH